MKLKIRICSDPRPLAWVTWTLLANNPVNSTIYLLFSLVEALMMMFYSWTLVQRVHISNFELSGQDIPTQNGHRFLVEINGNFSQVLHRSLSENLINQSTQLSGVSFQNSSTFVWPQNGGISLSFMESINQVLIDLTKNNSTFLLISTCFILGITLFLFSVLLIMASFIKNHSGLEKQSGIKRIFSLFLVLIQTFFHVVAYDLIFRTIQNAMDSNQQQQLTQALTIYIISSITLLVFTIFMLYLVRIFLICVPSELVPWCAPISKIPFINLGIKMTLIACTIFDRDGKYALFEVIIIFLAQISMACYRLFFAPNYHKHVDLFIKSRDFTLSLILFLGLLCKAVTDTRDYDFVYFIIFVPIVILGFNLFEIYRKQKILTKIKSKTLKLEIEYEFALYVMMTLVRDCMEETLNSQKIFGQLMDLMISHIEDCDDQLCICDEMENFYELLRLKQLQNMEVFPLLRQERKKYKKIIDDQGLIGTVSNLTDLTLKQNSTSQSSSTAEALLKAQNELEKLDRQSENEDNIEEERKKEAERLGVKYKKKENKKKSKTVYKINIDDIKFRFLSELLYLFYFEIKQKFPDSFKIQLLSNYFSLMYKRKDMLCVFQMRSYSCSKLSRIDQCCHFINEQYLLHEITRIQKVQSDASQKMLQSEGNFNGEYFIQMNQLYQDFNMAIESLSANVVAFWKIFDRPSLEVETTQVLGMDIAQNIQAVFRIFNKLDDIKLFKDYQMYFQFAIIQLHILNDPVAYELYIGKMKSILEINRIYQKNFTQGLNSTSAKNSDYSNFIIVEANGSKFGQIIQVNNNFRLLLGWNEGDEKRYRIEQFMPQLIREKHSDFMLRYNKTGQSYIIDNKVTVFIKKENGYVIPVELYIKFHYSIDYAYTFLAILRPFYEMTPYQNQVRYNTSQLIFMIADNEEGIISEYSESCKKLLLLDKEFQQSGGIQKKIKDLVVDLDWLKFKQGRGQRYLKNEIYEGIHQLNISALNDSNQQQTSIIKTNPLFSQYITHDNKIYAKVRIFEERYSGGVLDMNIFCFNFISENDNSSIVDFSVSSKSPLQFKKEFAEKGNQQQLQEAAPDQIELQDHHLDELGGNDDSQSATGSSSSMRSSTTSMAEFRNFHSFTEQSTPKTLRLIIQLIIALYIIMMTVASVNLGINMTRQLQSESDVHAVRQSFDRQNWVSMNQLIARVLLNIANGYETDDSYLIQDRFNSYVQLQQVRIQMLKDTQSSLQQSSFMTSNEFQEFISGKNLQLHFISDQNLFYEKKESMNIAMNLYIAKLTEMNSYTSKLMKGNLDVQSLVPNKSQTYRPSIEEQSIFFIVENGVREIRQFTIQTSEYYARESEYHAEQNITSTKVTAIVSIICIVIIGLIIAPILTKAEIRKYKALLYFLKIPKERFQDLIKNCEYCLNMNDENRYLQIQKDYESYLGIKLVNQQVEQLRQSRDEKNNIANQLSENQSDTYGMGYSSSIGGTRIGSVSTFKAGEIGSITSNSQSGAKGVHQQITPAKQIDVEPIIEEEEEHHVTTKKEQNDMDDDQENDDQQEEEVVNNNKFNADQLNLRDNRKNERKKRQNKEDEKDQEILDEQSQEQEDIVQKEKQIIARANKRRSVFIFASLSLILILSTYFIIAYFLAMKTFQTASDVIKSLEIIFYKGSCFDTTVSFLRESQIRNTTMMLNIDGQQISSTQYYLDACFQKERDYNKLRVNLPIYFDEAKELIEQLESPEICQKIYTLKFSHLKKLCETALDGIMQKGLTNAFYYMYTQIMKEQLQFDNNRARNLTYLQKALSNEQIIEIIDLKAQVLDPSLNLLKAQCMESVIVYIQQLLRDFISAFVVFATLLTVALCILIFVGFRMLRRSMWNTNIILKIIPFESLPKEDRIAIKDFFNS